jgi:inhibitor of Bruton tyrosine kinase
MMFFLQSKVLSKVTLPINHGILLPIINFLYTDECPEVDSSDSLDFICSMLVVADQLFISRLREMCEVALANLITLKNCAELCQFAHTYNATQLKQCCMEFIAINLCSILENKSLEVVEQALLDDISAYYCKFNPIMSSRVITPFFNAPTDEVLEECAINFPVNLEYTDEEIKKNESLVELKKKSKRSKNIEYTESEKARMRYESVSSVTSLDLSNEISGDITLSLSNISKDTEKGTRDKQEKWIEVPSSQQKQQKVVQARLKAVSNARDILNEPQTEQFTRLTKNNSFSSIARSNSQEANSPTTSRMSVSPKDSPIAEMARSPQGNLVINHIGPKMSQKQRKKISFSGESSSQNLNDFMANKLVIDCPSEKPKNPWKICEPAVTSSPMAKTIEFNQILTDQKKQRDDFSRIMTKPLTLTQVIGFIHLSFYLDLAKNLNLTLLK